MNFWREEAVRWQQKFLNRFSDWKEWLWALIIVWIFPFYLGVILSSHFKKPFWKELNVFVNGQRVAYVDMTKIPSNTEPTFNFGAFIIQMRYGWGINSDN